MRAFVPCAGFGTRLGRLTSQLPKPLLKVGKRPLVEHVIRNLVSIGIDRVSINLHHMPRAIPASIGDGAGLGIAIDYSYEHKLLGTAGTARKLWSDGLTHGSLLVNYGDVITDMDLRKLVDCHKRSNAWATILVHRRAGSNSLVETDPDGWVGKFIERPQKDQYTKADSSLVFSGICVLSEGCLESIPEHVPCDLPRNVFQDLAGTQKLMALELDGYRCAIDSPARLISAQEAWRKGVYQPLWRQEIAA